MREQFERHKYITLKKDNKIQPPFTDYPIQFKDYSETSTDKLINSPIIAYTEKDSHINNSRTPYEQESIFNDKFNTR